MTVNKSKRPNRGKSAGNPSNYSQLYKQSEQNMLQASAASAPPAAVPSATAQPVAQKTSSEIDWNHEYSFVFKDLRYLLIVSALLFAAIILIGFFL